MSYDYQPQTLTLVGFWNLKINYFAYLISFLIVFNVWYNNHNFFHNIEEVNDYVVWMNGFTLLLLSLLPFSTEMISQNFFILSAEIFYGVDLLLIHLFYVLMVEGEIRYNDNISRDFLNRDVNPPVIVILIGFVIG